MSVLLDPASNDITCIQHQHLPILFALTILRNAEAPKPDRLVGAKHQSVKVLLDLPESLRDEITSSVSQYGWDGHLNLIIMFSKCYA